MNRKILLSAVAVAAVGCIGLGALAAPSIKESVSKLIAGTSMEETLNREVDMGDAFMVANTRPAKTTDPNAQNVFDGDDNEASTLVNRYMDGNITVDQFVRELTRIVQMMIMENS